MSDRICDECSVRICIGCENEIKMELDDWRNGKRRVFWRVRHDDFGKIWTQDHTYKPVGYEHTRITVRPKGAKR